MENTQIVPKKSYGIVKTALVLLLLLAIAGTVGYYAYKQINWHPTLILKISTGVNETDNSPIITNVTFEQGQVIYKGTDTVAQYPEINVMVRNGTLESAPITYWASAPWNQDEESGKYTVTAVFKETYTPHSGDLFIVTIRQVGRGAYILKKTTAFYEWK